MANAVSNRMNQFMIPSSSVMEMINEDDSFSKLPDMARLSFLGSLGLIELTKLSEVSRRWKRLSSEQSLWDPFVKKQFPSLKIFDETQWRLHTNLSSSGLDVRDVPPLSMRQSFGMLKKFPFSAVEGNSGATLLTIPKGLTLNKLVKILGPLTVGNEISEVRIWKGIPQEIRDFQVNKTYRIVISNNIFIGSRDSLSFKQDPALFKINLARTLGVEMPKVLEALTLLVATYISSKQFLYNNDPTTFTYCLEQVGNDQLVVGCFSLTSNHSIHVDRYKAESDRLIQLFRRISPYGIGGVVRELN